MLHCLFKFPLCSDKDLEWLVLSVYLCGAYWWGVHRSTSLWAKSICSWAYWWLGSCDRTTRTRREVGNVYRQKTVRDLASPHKLWVITRVRPTAELRWGSESAKLRTMMQPTKLLCIYSFILGERWKQ